MADFQIPQGTNFRCAEAISLPTLSNFLCQSALFLKDYHPQGPLVLYEDWLQGCGQRFELRKISIHELFKIVETPRAIFEWMQGEEDVWIAVGPQDGSWYLRFYANWSEDETFLRGRFDVSLPEETAAEFRRIVVPHFTCEVIEGPAAGYYEKLLSQSMPISE